MAYAWEEAILICDFHLMLEIDTLNQFQCLTLFAIFLGEIHLPLYESKAQELAPVNAGQNATSLPPEQHCKW